MSQDSNTENTEKPLYTLDDVPDGTYRANPIMCGFTKAQKAQSKQFAIECRLHVRTEGGETIYVNATKFGGVDTDEGAGYALQDAENCGVDTSLPADQWTVNPEITVIAKVVRDEYGVKLKSIFADKPLEAGFLIKKNAIPDDEKPLAFQEMNDRFAMLRKNRADGATTPAPERKPAQTQGAAPPDNKASAKRAKVPI